MTSVVVSTSEKGLGFSLEVNRKPKDWDFQLAVTNRGPQTHELQFRSGQQADFVIEKDGQRVWAWSTGRMFKQGLTTTSLDKGAAIGPYLASWDGRDLDGHLVSPGEYQIKAYFLAMSYLKPVAECTIVVPD